MKSYFNQEQNKLNKMKLDKTKKRVLNKWMHMSKCDL